jgi:glycosyltransferase involved in cell wall biosynthesis
MNNKIKSFQFISITYNHADYILQHLESIKFQIINFHLSESSLYIIDDCSTDHTIKLIKFWLKKNDIFKNVYIIINSRNIGVVGNYIKAIRKINNPNFKILGGDDLYFNRNLLAISNKWDFFASPVIQLDSKNNLYFNIKHFFIFNHFSKVKNSLHFKNVFSAPGVFLSMKLIKNNIYLNFISRFKNVEDYPSWFFYFHMYNFKFSFKSLNKPFIIYRNSSGIYGNPFFEKTKKEQILKEISQINNHFFQKNSSLNFNFFLCEFFSISLYLVLKFSFVLIIIRIITEKNAKDYFNGILSSSRNYQEIYYNEKK